MAQLEYWSTSWSGPNFNPGVEHYWVMGPIDYEQVISITANAYQYPPPYTDLEIMVKDITTHVDAAGWVIYYTVRNTGANKILTYTTNFSVVTP